MTKTKNGKSMISSLFSLAMIVSMLILLTASIWNFSSFKWGEIIWLISFIGMFIIRSIYVSQNSKNSISADANDWSETFLLAAMFITMSLLPLAHLATGTWIFAFAGFALPDWSVIAGSVLVIGYLWIFWRSHKDLGQNWSPGLEVREGHELVTTGVYRHMRHPMYAAIWLEALAQPLLIHNWIAGFLVVPAFLAMYIIRVPREEAMMQKRFGDEYNTYMQQTGRIWPKSR